MRPDIIREWGREIIRLLFWYKLYTVARKNTLVRGEIYLLITKIMQVALVFLYAEWQMGKDGHVTKRAMNINIDGEGAEEEERCQRKDE